MWSFHWDVYSYTTGKVTRASFFRLLVRHVDDTVNGYSTHAAEKHWSGTPSNGALKIKLKGSGMWTMKLPFQHTWSTQSTGHLEGRHRVPFTTGAPA